MQNLTAQSEKVLKSVTEILAANPYMKFSEAVQVVQIAIESNRSDALVDLAESVYILSKELERLE